MRPVTFIDTSILCNLVPVPAMDQHANEIKAQMATRLTQGCQFVLPITTVIETGNHIAHLPDGTLRRTTAKKFAEILDLVRRGSAPWVLHDVAWNADFLERFLAGADTDTPYVDHALAKLGAGDLCILTERAAYHQRTGIRATVWSIDSDLIAHQD